MKLVTGDLWTYQADHPNRWVCITTNESVNSRGENIMGSGCAKELKERYPHLPKALGTKLLACQGSETRRLIAFPAEKVLTFPTKYEWNKNSDLELIIDSAAQLAILAGNHPDALFVLPRPGVGAGRLSWDDVRPAIEDFLPDNVHVITWGD